MTDETNKPGQNENAPQSPPAANKSTETAAPSSNSDQTAAAAPNPVRGTGYGEPPANDSPPFDVPDLLRAELDEMEKQQADLADRLAKAQEDIHRYQAEIQNLHRRREKEAEEASKFAITKFARDTVAVADNFERAINSVPAEATKDNPVLKSLLDGVTMTEREFLNVLERHGVMRVSPKDEVFDPHKHQAVMEQEDRTVPAGTVLQVYQPGYVIAERVLRPAMVVVARGGPKPMKSAHAAGSEAADEAAVISKERSPQSSSDNQNRASPDNGAAHDPDIDPTNGTATG